MQANILWTGKEYYSLENCLVKRTATTIEVNSVIIGMCADTLYRVQYNLGTNSHWETTYAELILQLHNKCETTRYESDGKGNWTENGNPLHEFSGCIDVDITLTPFTNTLAINRLKLATNESKEISAVYFDILGWRKRTARQKYTKLSKTAYKFENVPNDFEAVITVDEEGFVVDYPGLFERTIKTETNYG